MSAGGYNCFTPYIVSCAPNKCYDKDSCRGDGHWCKGMSKSYLNKLRGRYSIELPTS